MSTSIDVQNVECRRTDGRCNGFSLMELTIAISILLVLSVFVLSSFSNGIRSMSREKSVADRDISVKRALELMTVEIGHAGVAPDLIDPDRPIGPNIAADIGAGTTSVSVQGPFRGFYPGRPIALGLPENDPLSSETVKIADVDATGKLLTFASPTTLVHQSSTNGAISSPMLPNPFGILNPPPSLPIAGPPPFQKGPLSCIGFVGDIYGDGSLQYVEYSFANGALARSITPISELTKRRAAVLLDNVTDGGFTIIYAKKTIPIAVAVRVSITVRNAAPEPRITGGAVRSGTLNSDTFNSVSMSTEVKTHGTAAAALIWEKGGEKQLRNMLPPCTGAAPGTGFPPCSNWSGVQWWRNAAEFAAELP